MSPPTPAPFAVLGSSPQPLAPPIPTTTRATYRGNDFNHYGPFNILDLAESGSRFIADHLEPKAPLMPILSFLHRFMSIAAADSRELAKPADKKHITDACWLTIRLHGGDILPRWHSDGCMFRCTCTGDMSMEDIQKVKENNQKVPWWRRVPSATPHSKYATVLLGPATRFLQPTQKVMEEMAGDGFKRSQEELADALKDCVEEDLGNVAETGAVLRFSWGEEDSPVHSEPDCETIEQHRVFVSILFGNEEELRHMCQVRERTYGATTGLQES